MATDDDKLAAKAMLRPRNVRISARVYRAAEGRWVDLGIVAQTRESLLERIKRFLTGKQRWPRS